MKNLLEYYYDISIKSIVKKDDKYYIDNIYDKYILIKTTLDKYQAEQIYQFNQLLINYNNMFHRIVLTKNGLLTISNQEGNYILLKINIKKNRLINTRDILKLAIPVSINNQYLEKFNYSNWLELWKQKINYFEYFSENINTNNIYLKELINYYVGLAENAVSYIEEAYNTNSLINNIVISHKRLKYKYTLEDLYNPLDIILDNRVRDISEYLKDAIIKGKANKDWLVDNYNICMFNKLESQLLFGRMLFPSYFFDKYEFFINKKINEKELLNIINEVERYEKSLKELYEIISYHHNIPQIKWLIK